jgi:methyl-accepting chemotaxis protein
VVDYITLLGAEQVQSAANTMRSAADTVAGAASEMSSAVDRQQRFMDDWLQRFEAVVEKMEKLRCP